MPTAKDSLWKDITTALEEINNTVDMLEGFEMDEEAQGVALQVIKTATKKVRHVLHDYIFGGE